MSSVWHELQQKRAEFGSTLGLPICGIVDFFKAESVDDITHHAERQPPAHFLLIVGAVSMGGTS